MLGVEQAQKTDLHKIFCVQANCDIRYMKSTFTIEQHRAKIEIYFRIHRRSKSFEQRSFESPTNAFPGNSSVY